MLLSFERRFLFVANTKTASTSIESVLRPHAEIVRAGSPALKHTPLARALDEHQEDFARAGRSPADLLKFGVMRDPVDWILSWYRYRRGNDVESPLPADMDFPAFWARADWNIRRADGSRYLQRDLFCAPDGRLLADLVIPFDRIEPVFGAVRAGLGLPPAEALPRENRSRLGATDPLPPALLEEMRAFYAEDYALWDRLGEINAPALARLEAGAWRPSGLRRALSPFLEGAKRAWSRGRPARRP
ncbi:hypothetical protein LX81_03284 [Palleronia aestuarii]|uniref:Sulfotransferase family protein n=1 Tax=Palleronia aestuarii TaxID=568105 RepID=A0A2W7PVE1_9RHOB|nr:hypothetical protein [Palleronia aestuarii]PZX13499.1 hypothetical protein LX81_03284 [Palleronia aestuarii]